MNKYEFEEGQVFYSMWDVEIYDINGETVMYTDCFEDMDEAEELFNKINPSAGAQLVLRELQYSKPNHTGYLRTVIIKTKK